jgi:hypothetical protein
LRGVCKSKKRTTDGADDAEEDDWGIAKIGVVLRRAGYTRAEVENFTFPQAEMLVQFAFEQREVDAELMAAKYTEAMYEMLIATKIIG